LKVKIYTVGQQNILAYAAAPKKHIAHGTHDGSSLRLCGGPLAVYMEAQQLLKSHSKSGILTIVWRTLNLELSRTVGQKISLRELNFESV
jgi:hypothetical protein